MSEVPSKKHPESLAFPITNDCLAIGGIPVPELADRVGSTPFYAYDRTAITRRVRTLRDQMPAGLHLHYAMKANPMPAVVQHMQGLVDGIDVASAGEMKVALDAGIAPECISFAGPGKRPAELRSAIAAGITINMESGNEMETIVALGGQLGIRPRVAIRVNPDFELKTSGMKMSGGPKQFGIDAEQVPALLDELGSLDLAFQGLHIFSGSQNLRAEALIEAQNNTFELAIHLSGHTQSPIRLLNIGGGFGIPYFPGEKALDIAPIAENLSRLIGEAETALPGTIIAMELGRYLVGEAGVYVCRVVDRKVSRGQIFLITDGGLHHHLAASGNFGQVIRKNYPVVVANHVHGGEREIATVVGPLCTPLDVLANQVEIAKADIGDYIAVLQSGAYGYSASPLQFLSHPAPQQVMVG